MYAMPFIPPPFIIRASCMRVAGSPRGPVAIKCSSVGKAVFIVCVRSAETRRNFLPQAGQ
jgi:hypothetical protein